MHQSLYSITVYPKEFGKNMKKRAFAKIAWLSLCLLFLFFIGSTGLPHGSHAGTDSTPAQADLPGLSMDLLWMMNAHMVMEGPPMVADLDLDGDHEILTAAYENMIAVDGEGKELWRFDTSGRYQTCPAILERKDQLPLIYAADNKGLFTCLDGKGMVVWQVTINPVFCSSPTLADLDGNGSIEVILGDKQGTIHVLDAMTGRDFWRQRVEGECSSCAIGNLAGDGSLEIVVTTGAGKVFALSSTGELLWGIELGATSPDWATSSPILFEDSNEKVRVAIASRNEQLFCLDSKGKVLWERQSRGAIASSLSAGDIDQDGHIDLFAVTQLGVLYRYDEEGRVIWDIDTQGRSLAPGTLIDVNGDGALEYVLCTQNGNLLVFDQTGQVIFNYQFDSRTINMTPAFGDIINSRPGLEFAVTCGESGRIACFGTSAPVDTRAQWRTYRSDNRLTGAWFDLQSSRTLQMTPVDLSWDRIFTGEPVVFHIENPLPADHPLRAEASCVKADGSRQSSVGKVTGKTGMLQLPVEITAPGPYHFEWRILDASGTTKFHGLREMTLQPYANDQALVMRTIHQLRQMLEGHEKPGTPAGILASLRQELQALEEEVRVLVPLQAAVPGSAPETRDRINKRTMAINERAKRAHTLAQLAPKVITLDPDTRVIPFEGIIWENRDVDRQYPSDFESPLKIIRRAVPGEHEPVSIKLMNIRPATETIAVRVETEPHGPVVKSFEITPVATNLNSVAWDPLVPLVDGKVTIPSLATHEVWLDIDLADTAPGDYRVVAAFGEEPSEAKVEIELQVLPFEMAGFGAMRLCCWASYNEDAVRDLLAHGNSVFTANLPPVKVEEGAKTTLSLDFTELDRFVAPMKGYDVFLLMGGIPSLGVPIDHEEYVPRFGDYMNQVLRYLAARGIEENHVALYPYDEPGGHGWDTVNDYIAFARQCLKAHPGLRFYVNGGGDLPMFQALNEITSIWCPGYTMLPEDTPEMDFLRGSGKTLWSYDCAYAYSRPIGANTKGINVVGQYRLAPLFTFSFGAEGLGYWCYNVGPSMWEPIPDEYPLVYVNPDKTHTSSRRWEAVREGMEDTRILIELREKLGSSSVCDEVKCRIRRLLEQTLPEMAIQSLTEVRLGMARYVLDMTNNDAAVNRLRGEILDCVEMATR